MTLSPDNIFSKKIICAPLDWGLGHTTRMIPIIQQLQAQQNTCVIACTPKQKKILEKELALVSYMDLFGYNMRYSGIWPLWFKIALQIPRLSHLIKKERKWLKSLLQHESFDLILTDNRFGFFHPEIPSIFITHQLTIQTPFFKKQINQINQRYIEKFTACWIPYYADKTTRLSGVLTDTSNCFPNVHFIGPLSRLKKGNASQKKYRLLVLLSGPEPQRSILEEKLLYEMAFCTDQTAWVRGTYKSSEKPFPAHIKTWDMASKEELQALIEGSEKIICRSGYSTLMDLDVFKKKALLIPTPGQSEQEYLAQYWNIQFKYPFLNQKKISSANLKNFLDSE